MHSTLFFHERQDGSGTRGEVGVWAVEAEWWGKEAARLPPIEVSHCVLNDQTPRRFRIPFARSESPDARAC